jgi:hypothetical protein
LFHVRRKTLHLTIVERQQDTDTQENKYLVAGKSIDDVDAVVVAKLSATDKLVIITVYLEGNEYQN